MKNLECFYSSETHGRGFFVSLFERALVMRGQFCAQTIILTLMLLFAFSFGFKGVYILAKAQLAQLLIDSSWRESLRQGQASKPWPWADTWPVGRLQWAKGEIDLYVLSGSHGSSLAFGPGETKAQNKGRMIAGHRDTHFQFLQKLQVGDYLRMQSMDGQWQEYIVRQTQVRDIRNGPLLLNSGETQLVTCYPFDDVGGDGFLRYIVALDAVPAVF